MRQRRELRRDEGMHDRQDEDRRGDDIERVSGDPRGERR
jgi:hypothetical protein